MKSLYQSQGVIAKGLEISALDIKIASRLFMMIANIKSSGLIFFFSKFG